jgi:amino acid permease
MVHLHAGENMSPGLASIFLFNISVGTGALALPLIFSKAGAILGSLFMALVAFLAWTSNSFAIEAMSLSNALLKDSAPQKKSNEVDTEQPLLQAADEEPAAYEINKLTEYGVMADLLLPQGGRVAWFVTIILYFYGDLAVYCVFVPMTLAEVFPTVGSITDKTHVIRVYLGIMFLATFPWVFGDLQKTKGMQLITFVTRHICFWTMFIVSWHRISSGLGVSIGDITLFDVSELPLLFGGAIYSMINQMYIPALMTPVQPKTNLNKLVGGVMSLMYAYYMVLCWSAMVAFSGNDLLDKCSVHTFHPCKLQKLLTFNFAYLKMPGLAQMVLVLPLVGLLTSTPIIAITLRKNLSVLFQLVWGWEFRTGGPHRLPHVCSIYPHSRAWYTHSRTRIFLFPSLVSCGVGAAGNPPSVCNRALRAKHRPRDSRHGLVRRLPDHVRVSCGPRACRSVYGSHPPNFYLTEASLFYFRCVLFAGRQKVRAKFGWPATRPLNNPYQSPLQNPLWIRSILSWAALVLVVNTYFLVAHG